MALGDASGGKPKASSTLRAKSVYGASGTHAGAKPKPSRPPVAWDDSTAAAPMSPAASRVAKPKPTFSSSGASIPRGPGASSKQPGASSSSPGPRKKMTKGEYAKMIGVGPKQPRRVEDPAASAVDNYDMFADVEAGFRLSQAKPGKTPADLARESGQNRVMYTSDAKYRMKSGDGRYLGVVDLSAGEPPKPGSAAWKAAQPPKPAKSTGDPRLDAKRAKAKAEAEKREIERANRIKAKEKARREASSAKASIADAELKFYRDTVSDMAKKFNELKLDADAKEAALKKLETELKAKREEQRLLAEDAAGYRGGGGAIPGVDLPAEGGPPGPAAALEAAQLATRVEEAEMNAELEANQTATFGHMIIRMREGDPTSEERRANPHVSFKTKRPTAVSAGNAARSNVPWMTRKLEIVKQFQEDVAAEIEQRKSQLYRAENEKAQAEAMLARTIQSHSDKRDAFADQLGQRRSYLLASRAEDKAMAARKRAFTKQLETLSKTIAEEEANKKRGGKVVLGGVKGNNAKAFMSMMSSSALRTEEAKVDAALRRLQEIIPDITPDGLVEGFHARTERVAAVREESALAQARHDALVAKRDSTLALLTAVKEELYGESGKPPGGSLSALNDASGARVADKVDSKVYRAETRSRMAKILLEAKEKRVNECASAMHHLREVCEHFERSLVTATPSGEEMIRRAERRGKGAASASGGPKDMRRAASGASVKSGMVKSASRTSVGGGSRSGRTSPALRPSNREKLPPSGRATPTVDEPAANANAPLRRSVSLNNVSALELMSRQAREGVQALAAFFDKMERANVIAAADVHKDAVASKMRDHKGKGAIGGGGGEDGKPSPSRGAHNLRVVDFDSEAESSDDSEDEEERERAEKEEAEARVRQKAESVAIFKKKQPKALGHEWAKEEESRMEGRRGKEGYHESLAKSKASAGKK